MRPTFDAQYKKHQPDREFTGMVTTRGLYVLNNATPVSICAELGNIQNSFDQKRFVLSSNRQALATTAFFKEIEKIIVDLLFQATKKKLVCRK